MQRAHRRAGRRRLDRRGARYWDPLATFGYLAARTERIRFATSCSSSPYHHPLEIAKRYGTLDVVSDGRVILGVGVGTLKEEFDLIGAPYDDRGPRGDDALRALRASLSQREPAYHGDFYDFDGLVVDPCAVQERVPIWVGGRTLRSLRRAVTLADGWCPFAVTPAQAEEWLGQVELPAGFESSSRRPARLDPINEPGKTQDILAATAASGATIVSVGGRQRDPRQSTSSTSRRSPPSTRTRRPRPHEGGDMEGNGRAGRHVRHRMARARWRRSEPSNHAATATPTPTTGMRTSHCTRRITCRTTTVRSRGRRRRR